MNNRLAVPVIDTIAHIWEPGLAYAAAWETPPYDGADAVYPTELLRLMDDAGVDRVLQVTPSFCGSDNTRSLELAAEHPDRIVVVCRVDVSSTTLAADLAAFKADSRVVGIRVTVETADEDLSGDPRWVRLWERAEELALPVEIYAPGHLCALGELSIRHPDLVIMVDHLGLDWSGASAETAPAEVARLLSGHDNVYIRVSAAPEITAERYPFPRAQSLIRQLYDAFGARHLMWGSNYPTVARFATYRESLDLVQYECDFMSADERTAVLGGCAAQVLGL